MLKAEVIFELYKKKRSSPPKIVEECIKSIEDTKDINAFITVLKERAHRDAKRVSDYGKKKMAGMPIAVKDIFFIKGVKCTAGSKILSDFVPDYSATVIKKLEEQHAVIIGTTNLHEFASGVTTVNPFYGATRNPWDKQRIAGGSSGGSAAAVAAGNVPIALGTDTSGSIRIPASLCGVFGFKPSYGMVSKYGVFPLSKTLDHVGPIASSSWGIAACFECIKGFDPKDPASKNYESKSNYLRKGVIAKKAIIPDSLFSIPMHDEVEKAFRLFLKKLKELGIDVESKEAEFLSEAREVWAPIRLGEALAYHMKWYKSRPDDYGEDVLKRLKAGESYSAAEYIVAIERKEELTKSAEKMLNNDSVFVLPTVPVTAPRINDSRLKIKGKEFDVYSVLSHFTLPFNVTGQPAISLPAFLSNERLPIGIQIVSALGKDHLAINLAYNYEKKFGINRKVHL